MFRGSTRPPGKQGSWYLGDPEKLREQLKGFLAEVPDQIDESKLPIPGARIIIAPHAGYTYSGPTAAWAYKALDLSQAKRVFILGPSHTYYLRGCAVTTYKQYGTPFGNLVVDRQTLDDLRSEFSLPDIPRFNDNKEHSLEMHLPYLWMSLERAFGDDPSLFPTVVPIMVGDGNKKSERQVGSWLAPYIADPTNAFIVSSDFCHWGDGFDYTPYNSKASPDGPFDEEYIELPDETPEGSPVEVPGAVPENRLEADPGKRPGADHDDKPGAEPDKRLKTDSDLTLAADPNDKPECDCDARPGVNPDEDSEAAPDDNTKSGPTDVPGAYPEENSKAAADDGAKKAPVYRPIHETIKMLDDQAIDAIKTGEYAKFYDNLQTTKNTVCGRHPIGVTMAALEDFGEETGQSYRFRFVKYDRSNLVTSMDDMSVSYVSAYAIV